jgi:S1-C subfamily serine protease
VTEPDPSPGVDWSRGGNREGLAAPTPATPPRPNPAPGTRRGIGLTAVAAIAGVASLVGGLAGGGLALLLDGDSAPAGSESNGPGPAATQVSVEITDAIVLAAEKGRASVVRIESRRRASERVEVGSGVVIDAAGHVVTNAHVVVGTDLLRVFLPDGTEHPAILIGHDDPFTDVAVLLIDPGAAPALEIGDSDNLRPGETVVAVGNPLSTFTGSVSAGIVSGVGRTRILDGYRYDDLVQTDAAINSGNSGGALLNLAGQFVAMPTAILRETDTGLPVSGIGFAIPSSRVIEIANQIIAGSGAIDRASIGATFVHVTRDVADAAGLAADAQGAFITAIESAGPAVEAGMQAGDLVTAFDGQPIDREHPLLNALADKAPGETVTIAFARNGRIVETQIRLGRRS